MKSSLVQSEILELKGLKKYPKELFYRGSLELLNRPKVSIVGTRRPSQYTKNFTYQLAQALSKRGVCVVSGGAMGVDAMAHNGAGVKNSIAVVANGLDIYYPSVNKSLLIEIEQNGLILSQFKDGTKAQKWSFVVRNELVVALGDILIISQADINSGSLSSFKYAKEMGKDVFVLPHRLDESLGTNNLLEKNEAKAIYNIDKFASMFGYEIEIIEDEFTLFCKTSPTLEEALAKFDNRVYEEELNGTIAIINGTIRLI